jgi:hypothetical protein
MLRRKKPGKVSWEATSFKESFGVPGAIFRENRQFARIFARKRALESGPNWLPASSTFSLTTQFDARNDQAIP